MTRTLSLAQRARAWDTERAAAEVALGATTRRVLGAGLKGVAWTTTASDVLKLTDDAREVAWVMATLALRRQGHPLPGMVSLDPRGPRDVGPGVAAYRRGLVTLTARWTPEPVPGGFASACNVLHAVDHLATPDDRAWYVASRARLSALLAAAATRQDAAAPLAASLAALLARDLVVTDLTGNTGTLPGSRDLVLFDGRATQVPPVAPPSAVWTRPAR